jgi:hypothetical protein
VARRGGAAAAAAAAVTTTIITSPSTDGSTRTSRSFVSLSFYFLARPPLFNTAFCLYLQASLAAVYLLYVQ